MASTIAFGLRIVNDCVLDIDDDSAMEILSPEDAAKSLRAIEAPPRAGRLSPRLAMPERSAEEQQAISAQLRYPAGAKKLAYVYPFDLTAELVDSLMDTAMNLADQSASGLSLIHI